MIEGLGFNVPNFCGIQWFSFPLQPKLVKIQGVEFIHASVTDMEVTVPVYMERILVLIEKPSYIEYIEFIYN